MSIWSYLRYCVPCQLRALIINCLVTGCGGCPLPSHRGSGHQQRGISQAGDQLPTWASSLLYSFVYLVDHICPPALLIFKCWCFHSDEKIIGKRVMVRSWKWTLPLELRTNWTMPPPSWSSSSPSSTSSSTPSTLWTPPQSQWRLPRNSFSKMYASQDSIYNIHKYKYIYPLCDANKV